MRTLLPLALLVPILFSGCASQQTLDTQAAAARDLATMKQTVAGLTSAQADMAARLERLEAAQALAASRLDAQAGANARLDRLEAGQAALAARVDAQAAAANNLDSLRGDVQTLLAARQTDADRIEAAARAAADAREQADDAVKIARDSRLVSGKLVDSLLLTENMVLYSYEQPALTPDGREALDKLIAAVKPKLPHVFVEIIGYSDNLSLDSQNRRIALERAESVRRYLHETGGLPLDRMSTISYGDLKPVASNDTFEGRGQNRRVWVRVLR